MPFKYVARTPKAITESILVGVRQQCPTALAPVFVPVVPHPRAALGKCYGNASMSAEENGGRVTYGWAVWELPGMLVTLEHHAVVETNAGLLDVSLLADRTTRVLFAPDPATAFQPEAYATSAGGTNRFFPLSSSLLAGRLAEVKREQDRRVKLLLVAKSPLGAIVNDPVWRRHDAEAARIIQTLSARLENKAKKRR